MGDTDSRVSSQFLTIGYTAGGEDYYVVKVGEEAIRLIGPCDDGEEPAYASVYHLLIHLDMRAMV